MASPAFFWATQQKKFSTLAIAVSWQSNPTTLCHRSSQHLGPSIRPTRAMRDDHRSSWKRATEGMIAIDFSKRFSAQHRKNFTISSLENNHAKDTVHFVCDRFPFVKR
jgi:hypothetical protein